jgi:hypothetical protein
MKGDRVVRVMRKRRAGGVDAGGVMKV